MKPFRTIRGISSPPWAHELRPRLTANLSFLYELDDYKDGLDREDDLYDAEVGLTYRWKRYLDVGAAYQFEKRNSNLDSEDYTANVFYFSLVGTLQ